MVSEVYGRATAVWRRQGPGAGAGAGTGTGTGAVVTRKAKGSDLPPSEKKR